MGKKVNRNTHPILVEARKASFEAGHREGYKKDTKTDFKKVRDSV